VHISPGNGMEEYFAEMGKIMPGQEMPDMVAIQALFNKYDSEILGPPMK